MIPEQENNIFDCIKWIQLGISIGSWHPKIKYAYWVQ